MNKVHLALPWFPSNLGIFAWLVALVSSSCAVSAEVWRIDEMVESMWSHEIDCKEIEVGGVISHHTASCTMGLDLGFRIRLRVQA